jgi:surface antigen
MKNKIIIVILLIVALLAMVILMFGYEVKSYTANRQYHVGMAIDSMNGVKVYFNGKVSNVSGRNVASDGYNIGLKYQCVEFVKRYYYEHYHHKMPDSYGHAKSFFDRKTADGKLNKRRNLIQYTNPSGSKPKSGDLIVFDGTGGNPYGHVAIISKVSDYAIEIIQQNPGKFASSRKSYVLRQTSNNRWEIKQNRILGWLRKR